MDNAPIQRIPRVLTPPQFQQWFDSTPTRSRRRERKYLLWLSRNARRVLLTFKPDSEDYDWVVFDAPDAPGVKWNEKQGWACADTALDAIWEKLWETG